MKQFSLLFLSLAVIMITVADEWKDIQSSKPAPAKITLESSNIETSIMKVKLDGFFLNNISTPEGNSNIVSVEEGTPILEKGSPDLYKLAASVIIPNLANMSVKITNSSFMDFENIEVAPSKGNLTRDMDPSKIPFEYGSPYQTNSFYPEKLVELRDPHIVRDYRGQTVVIYPFQYNPVSKTLRVYFDMTIEIYQDGKSGINPLIKTKTFDKVDAEFKNIYASHFLNNDESKYTAVEEQGKMLIISFGSFMSDMQAYVDWKNTIGIPTEIVDVADIGNSSAIKTYIANYYNTNGLTYVLLVGDAAQVPSSYSSGDSDNDYSYIVGTDHYPDIFVGRFSAENTAHVQTMVQRTIDYEQNATIVSDYYIKNIGIASNQGPGDDGEYDYEHIRNMQSDLLNYTYTYNYEHFDGDQGGNDASGNPTPSQVATDINSGSGIILYTGHGSTTSWGSSGFSNTDVNTLTNNDKLPFIWSVACVNGNFVGSTCFAEAWLRATNNNEPSGAIATLMSTINQSWNPPMEGQDEMVDILVESYAANIKRTFGGISMNGCMQMNDTYGAAGDEITDTWTCFGDPSLIVRTAVPQNMTVSHNPVILLGANQFTINCNVEGALACLTINNQIIGTAYVSGGSAIVNFDPLTTIGNVTIAVTAYNYIPYLADVDIVPASGPYINLSDYQVNDATGNNNGEPDYNEDITLHITLENAGSSPATNVAATLSTSDTHAAITDNTQFWGTISDGATSTQNNAFALTISDNIPDQYVINFDLEITGDSKDTWNTSFSLTVNAPVLECGLLTINDGNGKLDPGETVDILIETTNSGHSDSPDATGTLSCTSPYITINNSTYDFGAITTGATEYATFNISVSGATPPGTNAFFEYDVVAGNYSSAGSYTEIIGQIPVLILDLDGIVNSGPEMGTAMDNLSIPYDYVTSFPADLSLYRSIFVCLGIYSSNHTLSTTEGQDLADYLNSGGKLYMEGGDTWAYDSQTAVYSMFNIEGVADGTSDMSAVAGQTGTFTEGMSFSYSGENSYMDHLNPISPAFLILENQSPVYGTGVAYDAGTYKTIGVSHEFGGLTDGASPSTKTELMYEYLDFFGLIQAAEYTVALKVFLEGPFSDTEMETNLNLLGLIPNEQPYDSNPWYYGGTESIVSIPNNDIADWILLEFRDTPGDASTATSTTTFEYQATFLLKDGSIVGLDGLSKLTLVNPVNNNLFVVIHHRNHIPIMSANPIALSGNLYEYDFTLSEGNILGGIDCAVEVSPGIWGMAAGDGMCDGIINDDDKTIVWDPEAGIKGYQNGDFNMDGQVNNKDKNDCWKPNIGLNKNIPN